MNRTQRFMSAMAVITAVELAGWRAALLVCHEVHRPAGLPWLATLVLVGALATVVVWLVVLFGLVRP